MGYMEALKQPVVSIFLDSGLVGFERFSLEYFA